MVHILNIYEIKHIIKTYYEDNLKKDKYASQKNEIKNQYRNIHFPNHKDNLRYFLSFPQNF